MLRTCQTGVKLSSSTFPSMTHGAASGRGQDAFSWLWTSGTCPVSPSCPTTLGPRGSGWPRGTGVGGALPLLALTLPCSRAWDSVGFGSLDGLLAKKHEIIPKRIQCHLLHTARLLQELLASVCRSSLTPKSFSDFVLIF